MRPAQRDAYNKAALCAGEAITALLEVRVSGWQAHVVLNDVLEKLHETTEALLDIDPNVLGYETRELLRRLER